MTTAVHMAANDTLFTFIFTFTVVNSSRSTGAAKGGPSLSCYLQFQL